MMRRGMSADQVRARAAIRQSILTVSPKSAPVRREGHAEDAVSPNRRELEALADVKLRR
jgi:hypothetical protein